MQKTAQKDYFGREIKVGDVVIFTNNSSLYIWRGEKAAVVTRLGSDDKIQINGSSYGKADYTLVVTEQFKHQFGEEAYNALVEDQREHLNEKPVEKKLPSPKYWLRKEQDYSKLLPVRLFVLKIQANNGPETYAQTKAFFDSIPDFDCKDYSGYRMSRGLNKRNEWSYADVSQLMTAKRMKELGFEDLLDKSQEITSDMPEFTKLLQFKDY
jgi:hypothetical protein